MTLALGTGAEAAGKPLPLRHPVPAGRRPGRPALRPAPRLAPQDALTRARAQSRLADVSIAVGIAGLPILRPMVAGNLGPADAAILVAISAVLLWAATTRQMLRGAYVLPTTIIMLGGVVAGLAGAAPGAALLAVLQDAYLLLWALMCLNTARTAESAERMVRAWSWTSCAWAVSLFFVVGRTAISSSAADTRLAFTADTNGAGLYFVLSIFVMIAAQRPRRRLLRWTGIAFLVADTVLTGSLGALSGLLAGLAAALMVGVLARRGPAPALALALAMGLAVGSGTLFVQRYRVVEAAHGSNNPLLRNSLGRGDQSSAERAALTKETLGLVGTVGPLGYGPNTTEQVLRDDQAPYPKQAHNDWIASLVERGVLGLAGIALLGFEVARRTSQVRDPALLRSDWADAFPAPHYLAGGVMTVAIFSLTHEVLHDRTAWTLLAVIAALAVFGRRNHQSAGGE